MPEANILRYNTDYVVIDGRHFAVSNIYSWSELARALIMI
jgi:hypothetical protein